MTIAGKGAIPTEYRDVLTEHDDNIELTNEFVPNEEVGRYFRRSSLVLVPHRRQTGHSGTLTIAYSLGKPMVATNVGDFDRLVAEPGAGRVVPLDNLESLANAVVEILTDESLRGRMCRASEAMADELSWNSIAKQHVDVYEAIVRRSD